MDVPLDIVAPAGIVRIAEILSKFTKRFQYQRTLFVGSPCSDEGTVGLVPDEDITDILPALQRELDVRARHLKASMVVWKDLPYESVEKIGSILNSFGLFSLVSYPGTLIKLQGGEFDDYMRTLSSSQRNKLKKKLRLSNKRGTLNESVIQYPDEELLREIFILFLKTYEHGNTKFERLTLKFFELIAAQPVSHFILLRDTENGKLVAFMLCFVTGKRLINKFIGIDYSYKGDWFLYFRLWAAAVAWALSIGAEELQSGQTGYQAKYDLGHKFVPLYNYCRHLSPVVHIIFKKIASHISWSTLDDDLANLEPVLKKGPEAQYASS
jgi:predicted N-acyltransferase